MQSQAVGLRAKGHMISLVATMGALHEGHISLIRQAREKADRVIVSIFVNPAQFAPSEDFNSYPRIFEEDCAICEREGVDIVFAPSEADVYPKGYSSYVEETDLSQILCGKSRPDHFKGVCTIIVKLFNICRPDIAFFGEKDAQQAAIIRKLTTDLNFNVDIETVPTVRDDDGLACSSRNSRLTKSLREDALKIYKALCKGKEMADQGISQSDRIEAEIMHELKSSRRLRIIYVTIVDKQTLAPVKTIEPGNCMIAVAVWVDEVRLIDNINL